MAGAASIAAVILALVFAWAGVAKAARHRATVDAFATLGLPAPPVLAVGVPIAEIAIAASLIVAPAVGGALVLAALAAFTLVVIRGIMRGTSGGCGCFGSRRVDPVSPADVIRNGLLAAFAAVATGTTRLVRPGVATVVIMLAAVAVAAAIQRVTRGHLGRPTRTRA